MAIRRSRKAEAEDDRLAADLIRRLQAGEEAAFQRIYDLYAAPVFAYLRVALNDDGDAEDATQDVFMKALKALPAYRITGAPFRVWLFRVARNHAINLNAHRSRSAPEKPEEIERRIDGAQADLWDDDLERPGSHALLGMLSQLPPAQRHALVLHRVLGFDIAEVAKVIERSPNAVRMLERRAIDNLRSRLDSYAAKESVPPERLALSARRRESPVARVRRLALAPR